MTERRLLLIRHAKAEPGTHDLDRPLARRGHRDAVAIGEWLNAHDMVPDLAVVSPSLRTRQTWEDASAQLGRRVAQRVDDRVYANRVDRLVELIGETEDSVTRLAVVGHNPSLQELALSLAGDTVGTDFPTSTVAVFDLTGDWSDFGPDGAALNEVKVCRA